MQRLTKLFLILSIGIIGVFSCKSGTNASVSGNDTGDSPLSRLAEEKYGSDYSFQENKKGDFSICILKVENDLVTTYRFFVYDLKKNEVVFEPKGQFRKVSWKGNDLVEAFEFTRVASSKSEKPMIYNVYKNETRTP